MADQHSLTDELCYQIWHDNKDDWLRWQDPCPTTRRIMRAVADWQLEQVEKWLRHNLHIMPSGVDYIVGNLKEAMRPTTTQENN